MTRKEYTHRVQNLMIAIHNDPAYTGWKVGEALKRTKENAKNVPKKYGSYKAAWNNETMRGLWKLFNVD